jgi:mRNA interferase RelE/StbE
MYRIVFARRADKALRAMPKKTAVLVRERLRQVAIDPYANHPGAKKLKDRPGYRLRVGGWRIIYELQNDEVIILVLKIGMRGDVYR